MLSENETYWERTTSRFNRLLEHRLDPDIVEWINLLTRQQDEFGFDPFGFQPEYMRYVLPMAQWVIKHYFRVETFGGEDLPKGRVLIIANHSGQIPIDGFVIVGSGVLARKPPMMMRSMVEKWVPTLPFVSYFLARCGQVVGTPANCRRLLDREEAILVFPEGVGGISKTFDQRYRLQRFGLGFMRLALATNTPIVPLGVVGGEEQAPSFANVEKIAKLMGMPSFPITPTFPWLGPLGLLPYPVKYRLHFGSPMIFDGDPDDEDQVLEEKVFQVKDAVQALIDRGLEKRRSIFF